MYYDVVVCTLASTRILFLLSLSPVGSIRSTVRVLPGLDQALAAAEVLAHTSHPNHYTIREVQYTIKQRSQYDDCALRLN